MLLSISVHKVAATRINPHRGRDFYNKNTQK
jgi:hypothetical protein